MMWLLIYLSSLPLAILFVILARAESRPLFDDTEGTIFEQYKYNVHWSDIILGVFVSWIPIFNTVLSVFVIGWWLYNMWNTSSMLSKPVFRRKVVIDLKKEQQ